MKTWVRKTLSVGVLAAGALLFAPGAAHAGVAQDSSDNNGILNGTQLVAPVSVPLNIVGNAIGVAGEANAAGTGANWITEGGKFGQDSSDNNGIANGTQIYLPVNVPVNVVGNSIAALGEANAAGAGVNGRKAESAKTTEHGWPGQDSSDNNGILNGTQIYSPIDIPINICGNALSLLGEANAQAVCSNGGHRGNNWGQGNGGNLGHHSMTESGATGGPGGQNSYDNNGILNGTQVYAPISLPVNLAGNAIGILGEGNAAAAATNESGRDGWGGQDSSDNNGILNGTQIAAPIHVPVNVCGNALGILGEANASAACSNGTKGHDHHGNGNAGDNGDDDYLGDNGSDGDDNDNAGDNGASDSYGSASHSAGGRAAKSEASPVGALTKSTGGVGAVGLGGLDLLNTLG
jgi:small secreted domain DUF320